MANENEFAQDQSLFNLKLGSFTKEDGLFAFGYGFEFDTHSNRYRDKENGSLTQKIRVGIGPNIGFRISPIRGMLVFPNISGFAYPWPNEDLEFIPKSMGAYGYRAEMPIYVDLIRLFKDGSRNNFYLAAKPFYASKSGFYFKDEQTGIVKDSEAEAIGIKFGFWASFN